MKKFTKILALALVTLLAVGLLAGCGSDNGTAGGDAKPAAKTAPVIDINAGAACKMAYIPMGAGQEDFPVILKGMQEAIALYPNVTHGGGGDLQQPHHVEDQVAQLVAGVPPVLVHAPHHDVVDAEVDLVGELLAAGLHEALGAPRSSAHQERTVSASSGR